MFYMPAPRSLIENAKDIRLNDQDEVQQLLGQPPGWMLRWGIPFVGAGALVLLLISAWVQYPDIVIGRASILAQNNPPIRIMAQRSGRVSELLISTGDTVSSGQILAVFENAAHTPDVLRLETAMNAFGNSQQEVSALTLPFISQPLGNLQTPYAECQRRMEQFRDAKNEDHSQKALKVLNEQISNLEAVNRSFGRQVGTLEKEVVIAQNTADLYQSLYKKGAGSEEEKESAQMAYLRYVRELEAKRSEILNNRLAIDRIRAEQLSIERLADERLRSEVLLLRESAARLSSAIQTWKQDYCIVAPASGKLFAEGAWSAQQFIQVGEPAFAVLPLNESIASARVWIPAEGLGKVKPGTSAQLRLDAYPYKEFGILEGTVKQIAPVPAEDAGGQPRYLAEIALEGDLVTTYGISLPPQQEMPATARIITQKRSLLARIFDQFLDAWYSS